MTTYPVPTDWKSSKWWQNRAKEERVFHAKIPKRMEQDVDLPDELAAWADQFSAGSSLYIHGKSGTGKSLMAATLLRRLVTKNNLSGRFVTSDIYIEMLKDQFDNDNLLPEMYSTPYLVKYIQGVFDIIVLDGVGQERETEFSTHELGSLLRRRHNDMGTIIVTTSLGPVDFSRRYGERVTAVVNDMTLYRAR